MRKAHERSVSPPLNQRSTVTLEIEKVVPGGKMLARLEGRVFFVDGALPGELVKAKVVKDEKDFSLATVTEILTPHPERISPRCSLAGYCGGCDWQHASASLQKEMKISILKQAFSQFVPALELPKIDYSPSPLAFNYRNRVRPKFKSGRPCFVGKDGKTLVPFDYCHIAKDAINSSLDRLGDLNDLSIEIFLKEDGSVHFRELSAETEGLHFSQVNSEQNIEIQNWIISHCAQIQPKIVLDLYGGAGNFGLPISRKFRKTLVRSIEASPPLSSYGYKISRGLGNIDFFCSRSELFLRRYVPQADELVILDPPRNGSHPFVLQALGRSKIRHLILIACDPVSLTRDLSLLLGCRTFQIKKLTIFEMFPQTHHFETGVALEFQ